MQQNENTIKCPKCEEVIKLKANFRENKEGEYVCPKCNAEVVQIRQRHSIKI